MSDLHTKREIACFKMDGEHCYWIDKSFDPLWSDFACVMYGKPQVLRIQFGSKQEAIDFKSHWDASLEFIKSCKTYPDPSYVWEVPNKMESYYDPLAN